MSVALMGPTCVRQGEAVMSIAACTAADDCFLQASLHAQTFSPIPPMVFQNTPCTCRGRVRHAFVAFAGGGGARREGLPQPQPARTCTHSGKRLLPSYEGGKYSCT